MATERTTGLHRVVTIPALYDRIQRLLGGPQARDRIAALLFGNVAGESVLEIGCGPGTWAPYFAEAASYVGIDHNARHIAVAAGRHRPPAYRFICGDLAVPGTLPADTGFDLIVAVGILHHLDDRTARDLLLRTAKLLRPGGRFAGIEPVFHEGQGMVSRMFKHLDSGQHIRTQAAYRALMEGAFAEMESTIATDLMRIPYSHCILRGSAR